MLSKADCPAGPSGHTKMQIVLSSCLAYRYVKVLENNNVGNAKIDAQNHIIMMIVIDFFFDIRGFSG